MKGTLDSVPVSQVLSNFHSNGSTGIVHLSRGGANKRVFFKDGAIVFASSDQEKERLGERLVEAGRLSRTDLELVCRLKNDTRLRFGRALVELGLLSAHEVHTRVKEQVESILYSLLPWASGSFRTELHDQPLDADLQRDDISTKTILLEGVRRIDDLAVIRSGIEDLGAPLVFADESPHRGSEIVLTAHEGFVLSRVDGVSSATDLISVSPLSADDTLRCIYGLIVAGLLRVKSVSRERARRSTKAAPERATARPAAANGETPTPEPPLDDERARAGGEVDDDLRAVYDELRAHHARLDELDHYEVLGLDECATAGEIKGAYFEMAKKLHPDYRSSHAIEDPDGALDAVFLRVKSAYEVIGKPAERRRYDWKRTKQRPAAADREPETAGAPASTPAAKAGFTPEELARGHFRKGLLYFQAAQYHEAVESLREAVRLDPSQSEHHVHLGRALVKNPKWRKKAEDHFFQAVAIDRFRPEPYIALGELYEASGLPTRARRMYEEALGADPDNTKAESRLVALDGDGSPTFSGRLRSLFASARRA